jgi:hypothetical protein
MNGFDTIINAVCPNFVINPKNRPFLPLDIKKEQTKMIRVKKRQNSFDATQYLSIDNN